jgi:hypothetical protein
VADLAVFRQNWLDVGLEKLQVFGGKRLGGQGRTRRQDQQQQLAN